MQDDVLVEHGTKAGMKAGGKGKAKDKAAAAPQGPESQIARLIIRALWQQDWNAANPGKTPAERTAAWKAARQERMEANLKQMRRALISLKREGVSLAITPKAVAEPQDEAAAE